MYTDEDLSYGAEQGVFSHEAVAQFRDLMAARHQTVAVDEENFRLISGFNDIFVVIACVLLLVCCAWVFASSSLLLSGAAVAAVSWGVAEYFVRHRRMALPAIVLLITFLAGISMAGNELFAGLTYSRLATAALVSVAAALHWKRFHVPVTVAAGSAAVALMLILGIMLLFELSPASLLLPVFLAGIGIFTFAMIWDASDTQRHTQRSDVAFWLHLLAAPMIIHPVFYWLGVVNGDAGWQGLTIVITMYLLLTLISVAIDRRAFMVSSLGYVIYTIANTFETYGYVAYSLAVTGLILGAALLLLSAFWHPAREIILTALPNSLSRFLPAARSSFIARQKS